VIIIESTLDKAHVMKSERAREGGPDQVNLILLVQNSQKRKRSEEGRSETLAHIATDGESSAVQNRGPSQGS